MLSLWNPVALHTLHLAAFNYFFEIGYVITSLILWNLQCHPKPSLKVGSINMYRMSHIRRVQNKFALTIRNMQVWFCLKFFLGFLRFGTTIWGDLHWSNREHTVITSWKLVVVSSFLKSKFQISKITFIQNLTCTFLIVRANLLCTL